MATQGCARFPEFLQNVSERQILWNLCSVVFHVLTLNLPIQTSLSVALKLPVSLRSVENSGNRAHPWPAAFKWRRCLGVLHYILC